MLQKADENHLLHQKMKYIFELTIFFFKFNFRMWYGYLMPSLSRKPWSSEEEDRLLGIANMYSLQNWDEIASQMEGRSAYQCFIYFQTALADRNLIKNMRWTKEEDDLLVQLVEKFRVGNIIPWTKISDKMPGRYKAQLYNRFGLFFSICILIPL